MIKSTNESNKVVKFSVITLAMGAIALTAGTAAADPAGDAARADIQKTLGWVPSFVKALPENALPGLWEQIKGFEMNPQTALPGKTKELIGLAIAAQMPSRLNIYAYEKCSKAAGASQAEVNEAVTIAAMARHWSTIFNGVQLDEAKFRTELAKLKENVTKAASSGAPPPKPMAITDARSVYADVQQTFGFVPDFIKRLPPEAAPGAWLGFRNVELNPQTALPGKTKSLISLAVASQIPCRYCIIADSEFAKLEGATDREIHEAVAMAGLARQWIALVDGLQLDEKSFKRDMDRLNAGPSHATRGSKSPRMAAKAE